MALIDAMCDLLLDTEFDADFLNHVIPRAIEQHSILVRFVTDFESIRDDGHDALDNVFIDDFERYLRIMKQHVVTNATWSVSPDSGMAVSHGADMCAQKACDMGSVARNVSRLSAYDTLGSHGNAVSTRAFARKWCLTMPTYTFSP